MAVGRAQCDVPAHVAHEYCRAGRAFSYASFSLINEDGSPDTLPRLLNITNNRSRGQQTWFPLSYDLGSSIALIRGKFGYVGAPDLNYWTQAGNEIGYDLQALIRLDKERTADLVLSREYLTTRINSLEIELDGRAGPGVAF